MQPLDNLTVVLYRLGLTVFGAGLTLAAVEAWTGVLLIGEWELPVLAAGAGLAGANLHLYDPKFRWLVPLMPWTGLMLLGFSLPLDASGGGAVVQTLALGFFCAGIGMLALKEKFCFKIPLISWIPAVLFALVMARLFGADEVAKGLLIPSGGLCLWLGLSKWRMPLHYDIGDKSAYGF